MAALFPKAQPRFASGPAHLLRIINEQLLNLRWIMRRVPRHRKQHPRRRRRNCRIVRAARLDQRRPRVQAQMRQTHFRFGTVERIRIGERLNQRLDVRSAHCRRKKQRRNQRGKHHNRSPGHAAMVRRNRAKSQGQTGKKCSAAGLAASGLFHAGGIVLAVDFGDNSARIFTLVFNGI